MCGAGRAVVVRQREMKEATCGRRGGYAAAVAPRSNAAAEVLFAAGGSCRRWHAPGLGRG